MELERPCPPLPVGDMVYQRPKPISRSLDVLARPLESVPRRHLEEQETQIYGGVSFRGSPFLTLYINKPVPKYPMSEPDIKLDSSSIQIQDPNYIDYPMPDTPRPKLTPLPRCECCVGRHRPRRAVSKTTKTRILAWLKDVEPINHGPWVSFLPTCREASNSSIRLLNSVRHFAAETQVEEPEPEPTSFIPILDDEAENSTDEMDTWPYDGRGLYEHHSRHECGLACYAACQRRQRFRALFGLGKVLTRILPWTSTKKPGPMMSNSDVPHPPWWLSYRSNDDTLDSDEEDGDLELWLDHTTQKQLFNHELRFQLSLDQKPDSRIFSSWSEQSF
ncbi:unnamed protein product [Rhizoctonia solani]|uniref:Uncharacterized protein n=1 Tax=Rhizoctonia solani TaxID=456999 RepID=A0A8H3AI39_9AGAM|nr:unnamed protein product [Rhizoctonia solani]